LIRLDGFKKCAGKRRIFNSTGFYFHGRFHEFGGDIVSAFGNDDWRGIFITVVA